MKTYVTFGQSHIHKVNGKIFDKDCVAVITHDNPEDGRRLAFEFFGPKFSFEYSEAEFNMKSIKYFPRGLIEVN